MKTMNKGIEFRKENERQGSKSGLKEEGIK